MEQAELAGGVGETYDAIRSRAACTFIIVSLTCCGTGSSVASISAALASSLAVTFARSDICRQCHQARSVTCVFLWYGFAGTGNLAM